LLESVAVFWPFPNGSQARPPSPGRVQIAIRTKTDLPAFVITKGLRHLEQDALGAHIRLVGIGRRNLKLADNAAAWVHRTGLRVLLIVVDIKQLVCLEARVKSHAEQTFLIVDEWLPIDNVQKLLDWLPSVPLRAIRIRPPAEL
jgi:hypothetical protein